MKLEFGKNVIYIKGLDWYSFHEVVLRLMERKINFKTCSNNYNISITNIGINRVNKILKGLD